MALFDNMSIIANIRATVQGMIAASGDVEQRTLLSAIEISLNELAHRQSPDFYATYHREGRALIAEGVGHLQRSGSDAADIAERLDASPSRIGTALGFDALAAAVEQVTVMLHDIVDRLPASDIATTGYLDAVCRWESRLYAHREAPAKPGGASVAAAPVDFSRDRFEAYVRGRFPDKPGLRVTRFEVLPVGFSKKTIMVETDDGMGDTQAIVVRAEPNIRLIEIDGADPRYEFPTVVLAYRAGLPVPEPLWLEGDIERLGMRFFVSRRRAGRNYGTLNSVDIAVPDVTVRDLARQLARLHAIELDPDDEMVRRSHLSKWLRHPTLRESTTAFIEYWRGLSRREDIGASPLVARALNWLAANVPECDDRPVFVHADYGLHNVLIDEQRVSAILDWETSHMGDPAEDITHFLTFTAGIDRDTFLAYYAEYGGQALDEFRLRYFDVYQCLMMIASCLTALSKMNKHPDVSIKLTVLGISHMHFFASRLSQQIAAAERAKTSGKAV